MKTLRVFFVMIMLTAGSVLIAHAATPQAQLPQQASKEKIKKEELPAAAIKVLDGDSYKGWTVVQAYRSKVKDAQGKETSVYEYEVEVKKDNLSQVLKFDKDGNAR